MFGALTLSTITNAFGGTDIHKHRDVFGRHHVYRWHKDVETEEELAKNLAKGWVLDSITIKKIEKTIKEAGKEPDTVRFDMKFDSGFKMGGAELSDETKKTLKILFDTLANKAMIVKNIIIESSTDKVPIDEKGSLYKAGIKTNSDLSTKRTQSVIDYLVSTKCVIPENMNKIEKIIKFNQGRDIDTTDVSDSEKGDETARYIKIMIDALSPSKKDVAEVKIIIEKNIYHISIEDDDDDVPRPTKPPRHPHPNKHKIHFRAIKCPKP